ncbi:LysM peptidoglycan-binding domain-containing protein [Desulfovibrio aerotolerans]|uniref:LysM peptidoglycan-binding domain-containing protein n=1 Tax=Solidesulfovibrio aerotolerans TaxID=295255 RepID=A0A7C9MVL1_9BACT|nr:LysM domain-containing protein [Solidesulfovibrio aerotolerans]MYL83674.1 LysM peptidoglycan-binding domain-containing protein [Solidesulfovibrio aerotolerans]
MFRGKSGLLLAVLLIGLAVALAPGCSKYDQQERNVQYVSNDLVRKDAEITWRQVNEAHAAWIKAGASHDKADPAFIVYQDAYARYAVSYNELWDRQDKPSYAGRLRAATDALPPPPPGMAVPLAAPKAEPATPTTPGGDLPGPAGRTLTDPAKSAKPAPEAEQAAPAGRPAKSAKSGAVVAAGPGSYLVQPGDTLASIAKLHGLSEKRLMDANGITDPRKLAAGKSLTIPAP